MSARTFANDGNQTAEEAAAMLTDASITNAAQLDAAIAALPVNRGTTAASTAYSDKPYTSINSVIVDWVTDPARKPGDLAAIPSGKDYYVVMFHGVGQGEAGLVNVRHIMVDTEAQAREILEAWKSGDGSEESFAALANAKSTDSGSNTNGGLYENVYPGQMIQSFNDWCFNPNRIPGEVGIIASEFGYHVMYFVGTAGQSYRDSQVCEALLENEMTDWLQTLVDKLPTVLGDTSNLPTGLVMG